MVSSIVTSKGATTLSKAVRQALRVAARDWVRHVVHNNEVRLLPVRPIVPLFGRTEARWPARVTGRHGTRHCGGSV